MNNLQKYYKESVVPTMVKEFGYQNIHQAPSIKKVVINVGLGANLKGKEYLDAVKKDIEMICGQKPVETLSKKSISNFKIREGMVIGLKVTLRSHKMWDFLEKLVKVTLPRVRDFRGISDKGFDGNGNYSLGFNEHVAFPEIAADEMDFLHGLELAITIDSSSREASKSLLTKLGFPFKKE